MHAAGPSLKRPVVIGKEEHGLYILDKERVKEMELTTERLLDCQQSSFASYSSVLCNQTSRDLDVVIWHRRIGHIPFKRMRLLGLNLTSTMCDTPCDVCPKARQQRLPFPLSTITTSSPFELVHVDTWGPYHTRTHSGHRYFVTIMDDFTRATWTHLMTTKDEAMGLIISFVQMAKTHFNAVIKVLRSDNALELSTSHLALDFFSSHGILHQTSCINTPQ